MNTFELSPEERAKIEAPLIELDGHLEAFAAANKYSLARNERDGIGRALSRGTAPRVLIQIFVESFDGNPRYTVWASASDDRPSHLYWPHRTLGKMLNSADLISRAKALLQEATDLVTCWEVAYPKEVSDARPHQVFQT